MISVSKYKGNIVLAASRFAWNDDLDRIFDILSQRFADIGGFNDNGFRPHPQEVALRAELGRVATLARLRDALAGLDAAAVVLTDLGLRGLPPAHRNAALYALTLTLGYPTSTDQRTGRVAWDVKARPLEEGGLRFTTFSERVGSADMHTDSSFYPMPEQQFILYVVNAARCLGGHSILVDCADLHRILQRSAAGRSAFDLLCRTPVPFRVPAVYAAGEDRIEIHVATVFEPARRPGVPFAIRWRHDAIRKGLAARPEMDTPALRQALALVDEAAEHGAARFKEQLPTDTLLLVDNHHMLHGRTTYEDEARHLVRIRMSDVPNAERIGPSGVSRD
ncbi:hypothetical protein HH212_13910 [Massilia forsythiae]|uniref:TauD/TfdA-like domain-containing protein n=1 Tax=Massilia forsythiae TaxID=2728020 RepID=A0A7Z2VWZ7_9BURK|nr:TauD/TfdA family dioxygenase [Massilia forsythiae]QJE00991.1 hypothetical protein HH212_13910 [Massilia forsythiae]